MKLTKTNIQGYGKSNTAVLSNDVDALNAYKRRKKIFKNANDVEILRKQVELLAKEVEELKRLMNGNRTY